MRFIEKIFGYGCYFVLCLPMVLAVVFFVGIAILDGLR